MKALIMSGSKGTRLHPFALAKQLIPVANSLILDYFLGQVAATKKDNVIIAPDIGQYVAKPYQK